MPKSIEELKLEIEEEISRVKSLQGVWANMLFGQFFDRVIEEEIQKASVYLRVGTVSNLTECLNSLKKFKPPNPEEISIGKY